MHHAQCLTLLLLVSCSVHGMENKQAPLAWNAEQYKNNSSPQQLAAIAILDLVSFNDCKDVLDIGCGDGKITRYIAQEKAPHAVTLGIDLSKAMITCAQKTHGFVKNLNFEQVDITEFNSQQKYDLITAFSSLAWVKDQQKAFKNISHALKPSGKLVILDAHQDSAYLRARFGLFTDEKWKNYFVDYEIPYKAFTESTMEALLNNAGLKSVKMQKMNRLIIFPTREKIIETLRAIPAQLDRIPQERHDEFLNDILIAYTKEAPQKDDGSFELLFAPLMVIATCNIINH